MRGLFFCRICLSNLMGATQSYGIYVIGDVLKLLNYI